MYVGDWEVPICINSTMWCGVIREMKIVRKPIMGGGEINVIQYNLEDITWQCSVRRGFFLGVL